MSVTQEQAIAELKKSALADPESHMNTKGKRLVLAEIDRVHARTGVRAHVLVAQGSTLDTDALWKALDYGDRDALLVLENGGLQVRAGGGKRATVQSAAGVTIADLIVIELRNLGAEAKREDSSSGGGGFPVLPVIGGTFAVAAGGIVALAIVRRGKLAKEGLAAMTKAKAAVDKSYSDVVLACEELPGDPQATEIQLKAAELKKRGDAIAADVEAKPASGTDPVTIGKLEQLDNELGALRSTVLQKARK